DSGIEVSLICLGTMTFGEQNSPREAFAQMDLALERGVNFFDTAELYAIPPRPETYGRTEEILGEWLRRTGKRDQVVLATKIAGPGEDWIPWIRGGRTRYTRAQIRAALDGSLRRLRTDYVDLYQLHWPERQTNYFGRLGYTPQEDRFTPFEETLEALAGEMDRGRIRAWGLSNETPWGTMRFLALADRLGLPRPVSIQNPYNLLNRTYEIGMAEISWREGCGLLAYSPLAFGVLTGKYLHGARPAGARLTRFPHYTRYSNPEAEAATAAYVNLAREHGLDPAQMALAFVHSRPFVTSTLVGATTLEQLETNLASAELVLPPSVLDGIEAIHRRQPNPAP
ncbi:MAG: NADP(H)-dependent aldo-keto reductase, partial [Gammaproteobacteria bacterium]